MNANVVTAVLGVILILSGAGVIIVSQPIFPTSTQQTTTLPPTQRSDTIMNYQFSLGIFSGVKEVEVTMDTTQTLNILVWSAMLQSYPDHTFDFAIVQHQPDGIDAEYFSRKDIKSFSGSWSPPSAGAYYLKFTSFWSGYFGGMDVGAQITETWTASDTHTVTVNDVSSLIDQRFTYIGIILAIGGIVLALAGMILQVRRKKVSLVTSKKKLES